MTKRRALLLDWILIFFSAAVLVRPLFRAKYLQLWSSIESTFIADGRFLAAHWPHPLWQPLWYCGTRFDYIYPPVLRYGTALLTNIFIPVKAYHVFTALMFSAGIAGVYFMVRLMGSGRLQGWFSAAACALISPSFVFLKEIRYDSPWLMPQRLGVMVRYGEGPHIAALSLLPFALGFAWLGLRRGRPASLALSGLFCALVALTNFYGATALAILYPVLVWSLWNAWHERAILLRALAIPSLAFCLTAFWLTPSYLRITLYNLRYVSEPGNHYSVVLAIAVVALFAAGSARLFGQKPESAYFVFVTGSVLLVSLNVLGHYYFNFRLLGEPARLVPELDMTMILFFVEVLRRLWSRRFASPAMVRMVRGAVILIAVCAVWPSRHFVWRAWELYPKDPDYQTRVEYRISNWVADHLPGSRTFVAGSTRFWWDAWRDNAEVGGGSDQGLINPNPSIAVWEFNLGTDPAPSVRWLQSLGADAIVVSDEHSQDAYHDSKVPYKLAGVLPVLFDDHAGDVVYEVPRRYASLARVVNRARIFALQAPMNPTVLSAYRNVVEEGPDAPATTHWNGADSISVHADVQQGQAVLVQVTYDPAWRAYSGTHQLTIHADAMDFMLVDAPPGTRDITMVFETPLENRIGYLISALALGLCLALGIIGARTKSAASGEPAYPFHLRTLRALLRWLYGHLPAWAGDGDLKPFDPERLRRAETALRKMKMPDAEGDRYLAKHIPRLSKTLALVPPPQSTGRVLELGCYMQITPLLQRVCGYTEVRGAYYGPAGKIDRKTFDFPDGQFSCYVDHFDVERDDFPYPDSYFDLAVAGEIIEHMTYDPMWMLLEARRVLIDGGYLLISTPNVGSVTSVAKTLDGRDNPQIFFLYERPGAGQTPGASQTTDIGHVREYTCHELGEAVKAAGFEVELLFTTFIDEFAEHRQLLQFLALNGYSTRNRGEQTWCLARKRASLPIDRYPWFMYTP